MVLFTTQQIVIEDVIVRGFLDVYVETDKEVSAWTDKMSLNTEFFHFAFTSSLS